MSTPSLPLPGGTWTLGDLTVTRFGMVQPGDQLRLEATGRGIPEGKTVR